MVCHAIVALPGGSGTFEEVLEATTWERLGLHVKPIVIVNQDGYFDPLLEMFRRAVDERLLDARHPGMWTAVSHVDAVLEAIRTSPAWDESARNFAALI